jgi:hypothetical protein
MNKPILLVTLLLGGLGCFGSDPNMNSQYFDGSPPTTTGSGGSGPGAGGTSGGNATGPIVGSPLATFDTGLESFMFGTYDEPPNLNGASSTMKGSLSFDSGVGSPTGGSIKVMAPYSGANQYVDIQKSFGTGNPQDWSGRTLHVRVRASEGTFKGGAQVYAITTSSFVFGGKFTNFTQNSNWQEFTVDVSAPSNGAGATPGSGYDPTKVVVFGVQLNTGGNGAGSTPVTFNIDSFSLDPPLPGTTGAAGAGGGAGGSGGTGGGAGSGGSGGAGGSGGGAGGAGGSGDASVGN